MYADINFEKKINFTENDFVKYYKKIFDKNFLACLQKVKTETLIKKKEFDYDYIISKNEKYNFLIKKDKNLLHIYFNKNQYDSVNDNPIEFSKIFTFKIQHNKLVFYVATAAG
jgi:hypothetical protein